MFGKGFFRAGFTGWYRGVVNAIVPGRPGSMTIGMVRANTKLGWASATASLSISQPTMAIGMATADARFGWNSASLKIGME